MIGALRLVKSKGPKSIQPAGELLHAPNSSSFEALITLDLVARSGRGSGRNGGIFALQQHSGGEEKDR